MVDHPTAGQTVCGNGLNHVVDMTSEMMLLELLCPGNLYLTERAKVDQLQQVGAAARPLVIDDACGHIVSRDNVGTEILESAGKERVLVQQARIRRRGGLAMPIHEMGTIHHPLLRLSLAINDACAVSPADMSQRTDRNGCCVLCLEASQDVLEETFSLTQVGMDMDLLAVHSVEVDTTESTVIGSREWLLAWIELISWMKMVEGCGEVVRQRLPCRRFLPGSVV